MASEEEGPGSPLLDGMVSPLAAGAEDEAQIEEIR